MAEQLLTGDKQINLDYFSWICINTEKRLDTFVTIFITQVKCDQCHG